MLAIQKGKNQGTAGEASVLKKFFLGALGSFFLRKT
jgi:hypothetical protein